MWLHFIASISSLLAFSTVSLIQGHLCLRQVRHGMDLEASLTALHRSEYVLVLRSALLVISVTNSCCLSVFLSIDQSLHRFNAVWLAVTECHSVDGRRRTLFHLVEMQQWVHKQSKGRSFALYPVASDARSCQIQKTRLPVLMQFEERQ